MLYLKFRDILQISRSQLPVKRLHGRVISGTTFFSTDNMLQVVFTSDHTVHQRGFHALLTGRLDSDSKNGIREEVLGYLQNSLQFLSYRLCLLFCIEFIN